MNNDAYTCTGSIAMWVLHNRLQNAYIVWMLLRRYDRENSASGFVKINQIISYLSNKMGCQKRTAKKRLEEAVYNGFLEEYGGGYLVRSYRKMVGIAMNDQQRRFDQLKDEKQIPPPELFLKLDRKFTRKFYDWVQPKDVKLTIDLLAAAAAVQNSVNYRGKSNQGVLLGCHRSTVQRRGHNYIGDKQIVKEYKRFILLDSYSLLNKPTCSGKQIIRAFQSAELIFRKQRNYIRGRKLIHSKTLSGKTYLAIQLPNLCLCDLDLQEAPSIRESISWLQDNTVDSSGHRSDPGLSPDLRLSQKIIFPGRFLKSREFLGRTEVPNKIVYNYLDSLNSLLESDKCRASILKHTGAKGINPITMVDPIVWTSSEASNATPAGLDSSPSSASSPP